MLTKYDLKSGIILFIILVIGCVLRLWNLGYGLPHVFYHDEGLVVYMALNMGGGDLNPHHFYHPNHYYYLMFLGDIVYILWGMVRGLFQSAGEAWVLYKQNPTIFFVIARILSAVLGVLTIGITYFVGKKIFDRKVALGGGLFS